MKILYVTNGLYPDVKAGVEIYSYYLSNEMAKRNEVYVLYAEGKNKIKFLDKYGEYKVLNKNNKSVILNIPYYLRDKMESFISVLGLQYSHLGKQIENSFRMLLDKLKPDIVHFQHLRNVPISLIDIAKEKKIPIVLTIHDLWFFCPKYFVYDMANADFPCWKDTMTCRECWIREWTNKILGYFWGYKLKVLFYKIVEWLLRLSNPEDVFIKRSELYLPALKKVDKVIAISQFIKDVLISNGLSSDKVICIENGYDFDVFSGLKKEKDTDKLVFGFCGNIVPVKGLHILIDAFLRIQEEDAELRIYGSFNENSVYNRRLFNRSKNKANISFFGRYDKVTEPYAKIDIIIIPSLCETYSMVFQEALITKTPIIASDIPVFRSSVFDKRAGYLFECGNSEDLYNKIMMFIENPGLITKVKDEMLLPNDIRQQSIEIEQVYKKVMKTV
jgi:glycosyltransferase involved in cell wall biosynthesis